VPKAKQLASTIRLSEILRLQCLKLARQIFVMRVLFLRCFCPEQCVTVGCPPVCRPTLVGFGIEPLKSFHCNTLEPESIRQLLHVKSAFQTCGFA